MRSAYLLTLFALNLPFSFASPLPQGTTSEPAPSPQPLACTGDPECATGYCYQQTCQDPATLSGLALGEHCIQSFNCAELTVCDPTSLTCVADPSTGGTGSPPTSTPPTGTPPTATPCLSDAECTTSGYCFKSACVDLALFGRGAQKDEHCQDASVCAIPAVGPSYTCECQGAIGTGCASDSLVCTEVTPASRELGQFCTDDVFCKSQKCDLTRSVCINKAGETPSGSGSVQNGNPCNNDSECVSQYCFDSRCEDPATRTALVNQHCFVTSSGGSNCDTSTTCDSSTKLCTSKTTPPGGSILLGDGATCTDNNDCQNGWCKDGKCADPNASYSVNAETCFIFPAGSPSKDNCFKGTTTPSNLECDPTLLYCIGGRLGQGCNGDDFDCKWPGYCLNNVCTDTDPKVTFNLESGQRCATSLNCRSKLCDVDTKICIGSEQFPWALGHSCTDSVECDQTNGAVLCTNKVCAKPSTGPKSNGNSCSVGTECNSGYCNPDKVCESYASRSLGASCKAKEQCETWNCNGVCFVPTIVVEKPVSIPGGGTKNIEIVVPAITIQTGDGTTRTVSFPNFPQPAAIKGTVEAGQLDSTKGRTSTTTTSTTTTGGSTNSAASVRIGSDVIVRTVAVGSAVAFCLIAFA